MLTLTRTLKQFMAIFLLFIAFESNGQPTERELYEGKAPKYIFYFIGDGMGLSQTIATEAYLGALDSTNLGIKKLNLSTLPYLGFYTTYAANRFITGSAAAGTALATGHKTSIGTISMDKDRLHPYKTIAEMAKEKGYKVGIVSTVSIDHATPATFYAHQPSRNMYYEISLDLSNSGFNYFAGGGLKHPEGDGAIKENSLSNFGMGGKEEILKKEKNSIDIAQERGYRIVNNRADFSQLKKGDDKIIAIAPVLASGSALPYSIDQQNGADISLAEFTQKGIDLLDNPDGFFMMVEGGKIDWACHANDAATVINEVLQFDNAVAQALAFYKKHPTETLILVAADHETGGLALGFAGSHYKSDFALLQHQNISYENFTAKIATYRDAHPSDYKFADGLEMVHEHFGLGDSTKNLTLSAFEKQQLETAFKKSMTKLDDLKKDDQFYLLYGSYDPFTVTACHILAQKAGIGWTSYSHTASPIPVRSIGVGAKLFTGYFDNTDMPKNLMKIIESK
ncbi:alkaline phosphatase [Labilibaculum sp.]|uniref:alkaline phosphatase n=1 Tax=Labilibaculum sp. TaxID=2060723 RepID=UPI00356865D5